MDNPVTPLAALSAQMAPKVPLPTGFELLIQVMQQTLRKLPPEDGASLESIVLKATDFDELYAELAALQNDAQATAHMLNLFRLSILHLTSHPESA